MCIQMHAHSMRSESCEAKSLVISAHTESKRWPGAGEEACYGKGGPPS